jgi:hypothetical protein
MSWLERVFSMMSNSGLQPEMAMASYAATPSFVTKADRASQRRTSTVLPALPLEYTGIHGEYDPQGLAKRVAQAFDQHPQMQRIETLCIIQHGSKISLLGKVTDKAQLQQVVELAKQVEGTKEVDVQQVAVGS